MAMRTSVHLGRRPITRVWNQLGKEPVFVSPSIARVANPRNNIGFFEERRQAKNGAPAGFFIYGRELGVRLL
jgi:hypothetical protein